MCTESRAESTLPPFTGALIFLMQAGFATLSAGSIRAKNVKNILLKNLLDASIRVEEKARPSTRPARAARARVAHARQRPWQPGSR